MVKIAHKKVKDKKSFFKNLHAFLTVTVFLFLINLIFSPDFWWFFFPLIGWAMAVIGHYLKVFGFPGFIGKDWEENQFQLELKRLEEAKKNHSSHATLSDDSEYNLELRDPLKIDSKYSEDDLV